MPVKGQVVDQVVGEPEAAAAVAPRVTLEQQAQRALMNILEDFASEKVELESGQRAVLNILDDFEEQKKGMEGAERAVLNILDDLTEEKVQMQSVQSAALNIMDDFYEERSRLETTQRALLNILEDFDKEKVTVGIMNTQLATEVEERARAQEKLQQVNIELENASQAKDRFLASMSHELRTPLNAIIGFTGALLMKLAGPLTEEQERQLQTVRASSRHLLSLINDLLDLAKIESGKVQIKLEEIDLYQCAQEVVNTLGPSARAKLLDLDFVSTSDRFSALADKRAVQQILLNLVNNAIKFTDEGGVRLELRANPVDPYYAQLSVIDTGIGIQAEDQKKLFQAFTQIGGVKRPDGTGLGLHLSRKLADLIGGRIEIESEYGRGSTFRLLLKRKEESQHGS